MTETYWTLSDKEKFLNDDCYGIKMTEKGDYLLLPDNKENFDKNFADDLEKQDLIKTKKNSSNVILLDDISSYIQTFNFKSDMKKIETAFKEMVEKNKGKLS